MMKLDFKKFLAIVAALGVGGVFLTFSSVLAATSANVNATVTVQNIALTSSDGTVAYGTLGLSSTQDTCTSHLNDLQTITNTGNVAEDFSIKGYDTTDWTLSTAGSETYGHQFLNAACTTTFSGGTALDTTGKSFASNVASSGTTNLNLQISTPTATAHFTEQSANVTLTASIHT